MSMPAWRWLPRHSPKRAVTVPLAGHVIWRRAELSRACRGRWCDDERGEQDDERAPQRERPCHGQGAT